MLSLLGRCQICNKENNILNITTVNPCAEFKCRGECVCRACCKSPVRCRIGLMGYYQVNACAKMTSYTVQNFNPVVD